MNPHRPHSTEWNVWNDGYQAAVDERAGGVVTTERPEATLWTCSNCGARWPESSGSLCVKCMTYRASLPTPEPQRDPMTSGERELLHLLDQHHAEWLDGEFAYAESEGLLQRLSESGWVLVRGEGLTHGDELTPYPAESLYSGHEPPAVWRRVGDNQ